MGIGCTDPTTDKINSYLPQVIIGVEEENNGKWNLLY
jgi:hypothetical protein